MYVPKMKQKAHRHFKVPFAYCTSSAGAETALTTSACENALLLSFSTHSLTLVYHESKLVIGLVLRCTAHRFTDSSSTKAWRYPSKDYLGSSQRLHLSSAMAVSLNICRPIRKELDDTTRRRHQIWTHYAFAFPCLLAGFLEIMQPFPTPVQVSTLNDTGPRALDTGRNIGLKLS